MLLTPSGGANFAVALENEQDIHRLVLDIANAIKGGDLITLSGDLGAGKTTFARAMIRYLAGDDSIAVPSPTFTIMQSYDLPRFPLVHADLYRLSGASELAELGFDDLPENTVMLMEWPDRAAGLLPPDRLDIALTLEPTKGLEYRNVRITGHGSFAPRVERLASLRVFLEKAGFAHAERRFMQGDASTRSYQRITRDGETYVLMDSPRRSDGPPIRDGKSYSQIAHLAEDVKPFVALSGALHERGLSAPEVEASDLENGFLILEDLGDTPVVSGNPPAPIEERYKTAVDLLLSFHGYEFPQTIAFAGGLEYTIPRYDIDAYLIEAELLLDWYIPRFGIRVPDALRAEYRELWREALAPAIAEGKTWVMRDFHSPNLLWLPERMGIEKLGVIDFQDTLIGHAAYDLASLLQDARVNIPEALELSLLGHYARARQAGDSAFDAPHFVKIYATLAAQRASKIIGIFSRLDQRDGKPQYLRHLPHIWNYLQRSLAHPDLFALRSWYTVNVPRYSALPDSGGTSS